MLWSQRVEDLQFVAIEQRPSKGSLNMLYGLVFELILGGEALLRVFLPGISLPLGYAGLKALNLRGTKASDSTLVFGTRHALGPYGTLDV